MAEHREIIEYLRTAFPSAHVLPAWTSAPMVAPVFLVTEGSTERQLEIDQPILDDWQGQTAAHTLKTTRVAETMRDQPGMRVVLTRDRCGELLVEIDQLRNA